MLLRAKRRAYRRAPLLWIMTAIALCTSLAPGSTWAAGREPSPTREMTAQLGDAARLHYPDAVPVLLRIADEARTAGNAARARAAVDRLHALPLTADERFREIGRAHV